MMANDEGFLDNSTLYITMVKYITIKLSDVDIVPLLDDFINEFPYDYDSRTGVVKKSVMILHDAIIKKDLKKVNRFLEKIGLKIIEEKAS